MTEPMRVQVGKAAKRGLRRLSDTREMSRFQTLLVMRKRPRNSCALYLEIDLGQIAWRTPRASRGHRKSGVHCTPATNSRRSDRLTEPLIPHEAVAY